MNDKYLTVTQINKYINLANKALLIIMAVLIILLILLNLKRLYRGVSYIGISMLSSGILLCVADIFIKMKVDIKNIVNRYLRNLKKSLTIF